MWCATDDDHHYAKTWKREKTYLNARQRQYMHFRKHHVLPRHPLPLLQLKGFTIAHNQSLNGQFSTRKEKRRSTH